MTHGKKICLAYNVAITICYFIRNCQGASLYSLIFSRFPKSVRPPCVIHIRFICIIKSNCLSSKIAISIFNPVTPIAFFITTHRHFNWGITLGQTKIQKIARNKTRFCTITVYKRDVISI